jgi:hypothetical protein
MRPTGIRNQIWRFASEMPPPTAKDLIVTEHRTYTIKGTLSGQPWLGDVGSTEDCDPQPFGWIVGVTESSGWERPCHNYRRARPRALQPRALSFLLASLAAVRTT